MKKILFKTLMVACFIAGGSGIAGAQLPSQKAVPLALRPGVQKRIEREPAAPVPAVLPSSGKQLPKGAGVGREPLPSAGTPVISVADKRKKLPSSARNPGETLKRGRSN
jgi:hypothetical protein